MKKGLLSALLILSFGAYALYKNDISKPDNAPVIPPSSTSLPSEKSTTSAQSESLNPASQSMNMPSPTSEVVPTDQPTSAPVPSSGYKDGSYTGSVADAFYGYLQVKAVISGGRLTDVEFLRYPDDRGESIRINQQAIPYLKEEALSAQNAQVDIVSGATDSSEAFIQSLSSALSQAKS